jgi:hypothetical protein
MSAHTQGPWVVVNGSVYTLDGRPIAEMVRDETALAAGIMPVERDANAHLIAAAPAMLTKLQAMVVVLDGFPTGGQSWFKESILDIIAKAKGGES